ncbi:MAG: T9SS type A sorting domain-containing protein [Bacteroidia bacterium]|nr:T9SS type A sorting domain-containing protein [Bacteroidia bacterium]
MKNKIYFILFLFIISLQSIAQGIVNAGINIVNTNAADNGGGLIYINNGNYTNQSYNAYHGTIKNNGDIKLTGNWTNDATDAANVVFTNIDANGTVEFIGSVTQNIGGAQHTNFDNLKINNTVASGTTAINLNSSGKNALIGTSSTGILTLTNINNGTITTLSDNYIIINNTSAGAITGHSSAGSPTSPGFINGNLRRYVVNATTYDFPLGAFNSGAKYELSKIELTSLTGANVYIDGKFTHATPFGTLPSNTNVDGTPITTILNSSADVGGYWSFTQTNASAIQYDITCTSVGHNNGGATANQHTLLKRADGGSNWITTEGTHSNATQSCNTSCSTDPVTAKRSALTSFSDLAIGRSDSWPLPLELLFFTAGCRDDGVILTWVTLSETANDYFIIERSADGNVWLQIYITKGAGYSNSPLSYQFIDREIQNSTVYYRLQSVDFDGLIHEYDQVAIHCTGMPEKEVIRYISSISEDGAFTVFSESDGYFSLSLYDIRGQQLSGDMIYLNNGINYINCGWQNIASGIYLLRFYNDNFNETYKIIKNAN